MRGDVEIASGAFGYGVVVTLLDLLHFEWSFEYEQSSRVSESSTAETFFEACEKLHNMFKRFLSFSSGHDDGTSGVDFDAVEECIRDIFSFQNGKAERSEKWRAAFTSGELGIKPGEEIPRYDPAPWDKQRDHFPRPWTNRRKPLQARCATSTRQPASTGITCSASYCRNTSWLWFKGKRNE